MSASLQDDAVNNAYDNGPGTAYVDPIIWAAVIKHAKGETVSVSFTVDVYSTDDPDGLNPQVSSDVENAITSAEGTRIGSGRTFRIPTSELLSIFQREDVYAVRQPAGATGQADAYPSLSPALKDVATAYSNGVPAACAARYAVFIKRGKIVTLVYAQDDSTEQSVRQWLGRKNIAVPPRVEGVTSRTNTFALLLPVKQVIPLINAFPTVKLEAEKLDWLPMTRWRWHQDTKQAVDLITNGYLPPTTTPIQGDSDGVAPDTGAGTGHIDPSIWVLLDKHAKGESVPTTITVVVLPDQETQFLQEIDPDTPDPAFVVYIESVGGTDFGDNTYRLPTDEFLLLIQRPDVYAVESEPGATGASDPYPQLNDTLDDVMAAYEGGLQPRFAARYAAYIRDGKIVILIRSPDDETEERVRAWLTTRNVAVPVDITGPGAPGQDFTALIPVKCIAALTNAFPTIRLEALSIRDDGLPLDRSHWPSIAREAERQQVEQWVGTPVPTSVPSECGVSGAPNVQPVTQPPA